VPLVWAGKSAKVCSASVISRAAEWNDRFYLRARLSDESCRMLDDAVERLVTRPSLCTDVSVKEFVWNSNEGVGR
jgi:hypothetical protein